MQKFQSFNYDQGQIIKKHYEVNDSAAQLDVSLTNNFSGDRQ